MSASPSTAAEPNGLATAVNTVAAPPEAFEALRVAPTWGWALLLTAVLMIAGAYLQGPATRHASAATTAQMMNRSSLFANMTAAQKQQAVERAGRASPFTYVFVLVTLFLAVLFNTIVMLVGNAAGRGEADFKRLWAGSVNIALPTLGLGSVVMGAIMTIRGPDAFNSTADIMRAMPGLAMLASNAPITTVALLSGISIFTLWGLYLNATMLRVMARTSSGIAYTFAAIVTLLGCALAASGAAVAHGFGMG